jgi:hypothetical protein
LRFAPDLCSLRQLQRKRVSMNLMYPMCDRSYTLTLTCHTCFIGQGLRRLPQSSSTAVWGYLWHRATHSKAQTFKILVQTLSKNRRWHTTDFMTLAEMDCNDYTNTIPVATWAPTLTRCSAVHARSVCVCIPRLGLSIRGAAHRSPTFTLHGQIGSQHCSTSI